MVTTDLNIKVTRWGIKKAMKKSLDHKRVMSFVCKASLEGLWGCYKCVLDEKDAGRGGYIV